MSRNLPARGLRLLAAAALLGLAGCASEPTDPYCCAYNAPAVYGGFYGYWGDPWWYEPWYYPYYPGYYGYWNPPSSGKPHPSPRPSPPYRRPLPAPRPVPQSLPQPAAPLSHPVVSLRSPLSRKPF